MRRHGAASGPGSRPHRTAALLDPPHPQPVARCRAAAAHPDGYSLAASALPAAGAIDHSQLRSVASPVLERLHADTALVVHLGVLAAADVVYLDKVAGGGVPRCRPGSVAGPPPTPAHWARPCSRACVREDVDKTLDKQLRRVHAVHDRRPAHPASGTRPGSGRDAESPTTTRNSRWACPASPPRSPCRAHEVAGLSLTGAVPAQHLAQVAPFLSRSANGISERLGSAASGHTDIETVTDDMLSRVLRTLASDDWV